MGQYQGERFQNLQLLRFLASIGVVFAHVELWEYRSVWLGQSSFSLGSLGVDVFFVISGFIMVHVTRNVAPQRTVAASSFLLKRLGRILPVYYFFTLLTALYAFLFAKTHFAHNESLGMHFSHAKTGLRYIVESLTFSRWDLQPVFEIGWTLQYEFWFYLVFAVCLLTRINVYVFFATYSAAIMAAVHFDLWQHGLGSILLNPQMLEFVYGIFLYRIYRSTTALQSRDWFPIALVAVAGFFVFGSFEPFFSQAFTPPYVRPVLWGGASFFIVYLFIALEGRFQPSRIATYLGDASYSIYLTHWHVLAITPFLFWTLGWFPKGSVAIYAFASVAIAVAASVVVYRFIESPLNRIVSRTIRRLLDQPSRQETVSPAGSQPENSTVS